MKKYLLAAIMVILIAVNVFLLILMSRGFDFKTMTFIKSVVTESDASPVSSYYELSDISSEPVSSEAVLSEPDSNQQPEISSEPIFSESSDVSSQDTQNPPSSTDNRLSVTLDSLAKLNDYYSLAVGKGIGNHPANSFNGGYAVEYDNSVYYTDVNNSNYLYYSRVDLKEFTKRNRLDSWCINVIKQKIYYVCRADGCIYYVPLQHDSSKKLDETNKKLCDKRAVCLVAADEYLYYISPADNKSICGELRRMDLNGKNDEKLSPDGYMCENIIPCGEFILFVCEQIGERKICALEIKTSKITELYAGDVSDINYVGGKLWFIRHSSVSDEICCVESGSDKINPVFSVANIDNLIVDGDYVYYMTRSGYAKCFKMSVNGGKSETVYDSEKAEMQFFNVAQGYIYFGADGGKYMRRIASDGDYVTIMRGLKK